MRSTYPTQAVIASWLLLSRDVEPEQELDRVRGGLIARNFVGRLR